MFSNQTPQQNSFIANKRNELRKQIRREQLDAYFNSKRKLKFQQDLSEAQKTIYLNNFAILIQNFFNSQSNHEAQNHIKAIYEYLTKDNARPQAAILLEPTKLIKVFIMFPTNRYSVQILRMMIVDCYDQTFGLDDQKHACLHHDNVFDAKISPTQMTQYQQAIHILLTTINEMIPQLQNRKLLHSITSKQEIDEAKEINQKVQKFLKLYLICLADLSVRINSFVMRFEYVQRYLTQWSKWLLLDYNFGYGQILKYIVLVSKFIIPFQTLSKNSLHHFSNQQIQTEIQILYKIFTFTVPQGQKDNLEDQKHEILAICIIEPLFSYVELRIDFLVRFFQQIMRLLKVVLGKRKHFNIRMVVKIFNLIASVINKLISEKINKHATEQDLQIMQSLNVVEVMKQMEFLNTFSLYLQYQQWAFLSVFKIICSLIEYSIEFDLNVMEIIGFGNFFIEICHKSSHDDREIMLINLKSLNMICRYAEVCNIRQIFIQMVQNGVVGTLQSLAYASMDEYVVQQAQSLIEFYFTEEKVKLYTQMEDEKEMQQKQLEMMPDKRDYCQR